jgi:soluble lytic murein transglycosylase-like protein
MFAMRGLLILVRALGVLALAVIAYACIYPARVARSIRVNSTETIGAVAPVGAAASGLAGPSVSPSPPPAALPVSADVPKPPPASASQVAIAQWLGTKYHVVPEAIAPLVVEADKLSKSYRLSPNLLIAVMAIESNFHPYIQSEAGAQGLMQVMPVIHAKRYKKFGGKSSFIDPVVSLKVGAEILRDCVKQGGGSEAQALRFYFGGGAASLAYIDKVKAEQRRLNLVAAGAQVALD